MTKITLHFDKDAFQLAEAMHKEKNALIDAIKLVAKNELDLNIEVSDSRTLNENIFEAIEKKYKSQNTLNLKGEKLVDLMQIDLSPVLNLASKLSGFDAIDENKKPIKESYTITVETDKELNRYNHALKVIDLIKETRQLTENPLDLGHFHRVFQNVIRLNSLHSDFEPLPAFVKA